MTWVWAWYELYLLSWYKSTNYDTAGEQAYSSSAQAWFTKHFGRAVRRYLVGLELLLDEALSY
jgi:hypothetical protein